MNKTLYHNETIHLDTYKDKDGMTLYRLTFFNKDNHWNGDITFNKQGEIVFNDLDD